MAMSIQDAKVGTVPARASRPAVWAQVYKEAFEQNCHRVYSLAFWMTDNELLAEELMVDAFCRSFGTSPNPDVESVDRALIAELRGLMPLGSLTLQCAPCSEVIGLRRKAKRVELERALVQLPATERMVFLLHDVERYDHARIGRLLGLSEPESAHGLHQARLRLRELLAAMA